jgi:hypothetical protein
MAFQAFTLQNAVKGEEELTRFEKLSAQNTSAKAAERYVEKAYSSGATYYYKKGNKAKTRELLKRGISYAPDNFGLQVRLSQVH